MIHQTGIGFDATGHNKTHSLNNVEVLMSSSDTAVPPHTIH